MFKRFIDDGFGTMRGNNKDVETWIKEFNNMWENIFIDKMEFWKSCCIYGPVYIQGK